jgi:hypothetical protein
MRAQINDKLLKNYSYETARPLLVTDVARQ